MFSGGVYVGKHTSQAASVRAKASARSGLHPLEKMLAFLRSVSRFFDTLKRRREYLPAALSLIWGKYAVRGDGIAMRVSSSSSGIPPPGRIRGFGLPLQESIHSCEPPRPERIRCHRGTRGPTPSRKKPGRSRNHGSNRSRRPRPCRWSRSIHSRWCGRSRSHSRNRSSHSSRSSRSSGKRNEARCFDSST